MSLPRIVQILETMERNAMSATPNARFWAYVNTGPVKIALRPGQSLTWDTWSRTEEGWSAESCTWTHHGDHITREWGADGVDCDGRLSSGGSNDCPLPDLHTGNEPYACDGEGIRYPAWGINEDSYRRDYQAEAAGY